MRLTCSIVLSVCFIGLVGSAPTKSPKVTTKSAKSTTLSVTTPTPLVAKCRFRIPGNVEKITKKSPLECGFILKILEQSSTFACKPSSKDTDLVVCSCRAKPCVDKIPPMMKVF